MATLTDLLTSKIPPHSLEAERAVLPDLLARSGEASVITSRTLRTWGESESGLLYGRP